MEVLKKGNGKPLEWTMKIECTGLGVKNKNDPCHSLLRITAADIEEITREGAYNVTQYAVTCCECGCRTVISQRLLPAELKRPYYQVQIVSDR